MIYPPLGRSRSLLLRLPPRSVIGAEVGVFDGVMSSELLQRPNLTLIMVDKWDSLEPSESYVRSGDIVARLSKAEFSRVRAAAERATQFAASRRVMMIGDSVQIARTLARDGLDFVFIDADHSFEAVTMDLAEWYPCVKPGGLLCGHDYESDRPPLWGVKPAVDQFVSRHALALELGEDNTWFVRKPPTDAEANP